MVDASHDHVALSAESMRENAHSHGLTRARLAGDHDEAAIVDGKLDASTKDVHIGQGIQRVNGHIGSERMKL